MQNLRQKMRRVFADTIFNRLFGLAFAAVFVSHAATFVLLFVFLRDASHPPPPELRPPGAESGYSSNHPPQYGARPSLPHRRSAIDGPLSGLLISMSLQLLLLAIGAWISSRTLARPIQNLAAAASTLGDQQVVPVSETGPLEVRQAAVIFNQMQYRIRQQMEERARFLAAVSHDLRTPLTRMKLRIDQTEATATNGKLLQDIDEMRHMLDATLDYLRGSSESMQYLDIQSMLEAIVDNMRDEGKSVRIEGHLQPVYAMPNELQRSIINLLENAIFYGGSTQIQLQDAADFALIRISDEGPGIPESELTKVFDPFYRIAGARNKNSGGVGLGLSIAQEIIRQHHGVLNLTNNPNGIGLTAEIRLPRTAINVAK
jgi:protein-histidine pros-kinase